MPETAPMHAEVLRLLHEADSFAAAAHVQSQGAPSQIAANYHQCVKDLYWKSKDLAATLLIARAAIHYCTTKASESSDAALIETLQTTSLRISYNAASFAWPGWDEPGISLTPADIKTCLDFAQFHFRLAHQLNKPPEKRQSAHWILGAALLANNRPTEALPHFQIRFTDLNASTKLMYEGYTALTQSLLKIPNSPATFNAILHQLQSQNDEESNNYATQLLTAKKVFAP